ncbi:hypothetical protein LTR78_010983 [Recurvomyces mirabilis]|uniref:DOMON domain-containing protein n=1 Tax=Recurvomyces mirabilis TaxID=574656 RepID=A0AAE0TPG5_9PEZI|nr:hypothetical protein LTR78_010983 [Recurvomyces mirabilis]KAK5150493.1 hypothetical protein LTS14_009986 [Recurvomyces mirabilis]
MALALFALALLGSGAQAAASYNSTLAWVPFSQTQFDGNAALDTDGANGDVQLFWTLGDEYSTYGIASKSSGYLAVGFSQTGAMTGADMAVGYTDQNGTFMFENRHATGFIVPEISQDQTKNMRFKQGYQANGVTAFIFDKKNQADCLLDQGNVAIDSFQWMIYAHSDQNTFAQHAAGDMGKQYVKLGTSNAISLDIARTTNNSQNFTVVSPEVVIPTDETTYCYSMHKMPTTANRSYLIGERPPKASPLLHHLVLYACYGPADQFESMLGQPADCNWQNFSNPCNGFVTEWAPGMSARTFEDGFGKPFGADLYQYAMLETHYNNPGGTANQTDAASYEFIYTDSPVATEIGTLTLGDMQVNGWFMDPGKPLVAHSTICTPECTSKWPAEGITAVAVFHHMHYRGVNARVQIIRNGTEIAPLSELYDFQYGYQFSKALSNIQLLPGDQLITTCEYDTMNDTTPVAGGQSSRDEMCFAWVDYYPLNNVLGCTQINPHLADPSQQNGTVAMCLDSSNPNPDLYPSKSLTADFQHLPVSGNNCSGNALSKPNGAAILSTCPDTDVCYSVSVPRKEPTSASGDIYFQLSAPTTYSWVALAQGTAMSNANMFVMYASADGKNVTLSPRNAPGHQMPTHNAAADVVLLEGSGIANGKMTANVLCKNCSSWSTGKMDFQDIVSQWVYAHLQGLPINSDDLNTAISHHDKSGGFQWDLSQATGGPDANPFLAGVANTTSSSSTAGGQMQTPMMQAHGALASIAFVAIFPIGAVLVRLASFPGLAWVHGGLQIFSYVVFIAAAGLGIYLARQDSYLNQPHAIIGMLLFGVLSFMPILGTIHHNIFKQVKKRTAWSYAHIFTGRTAILLGMVNGGLGLKLVNAGRPYIIAYGVSAGMMGVVFIGVIVFGEVTQKKDTSGVPTSPITGPGESKGQEGSGSESDARS